MKICTEVTLQWNEDGSFTKLSDTSHDYDGPVSEMKGGGETTQSNEPPAYLQPHLAATAGQAGQLYANSSFFPGQTYAPFSSEQEQALQQQAQRAQAGSPLTNNAQSQINQTISGEGYTQPWFDAQFKSAMNRIDPQVNSVFSLAGRSGSGLHEAARTEALANAYGQFAGQERGRQMEAAKFAPFMAQQDYFDIGQLGNVGAQRQAMEQQGINEQMARHDFPWQNLQRYMGVLTAQPGSYGTTSTPYYEKSPWGALGGAAGGFMLGGPFGAVLGSQVGGLL